MTIYNNWQNSTFKITLNFYFLFLYSIIRINIYIYKIPWTDQYMYMFYMCIYMLIFMHDVCIQCTCVCYVCIY